MLSGTLELKVNRLMPDLEKSSLQTLPLEFLEVSQLGLIGKVNGYISSHGIPSPQFIYYLNPASECRTFLLYYLPILQGILPEQYLVHALLLCKAVWLLLGDYIQHTHVEPRSCCFYSSNCIRNIMVCNHSCLSSLCYNIIIPSRLTTLQLTYTCYNISPTTHGYMGRYGPIQPLSLKEIWEIL